MDAPETPSSNRGRRFRTRMASGLVVLIPLVVTVAVVRFLFGFTSGILLPIVDPAVADWPPLWRAVLSLGVLLVAVYLLGEIAHHVVGRRVLSLGEGIVMRVPLVKVVYSAIIRTTYTVEEGIKMVMSLGVLVPRPAETGPRPTP